MSEQYRQYDLEDPETFDALSKFYPNHLHAMTSEKLDRKTDIAWEFSSRDSQIASLEAERDALQARLNEAVGRIKDILIQDDGQAYKEAEKFLDKLEGEGT
jgi:dienelactone hydrolase